MPGVVFKFDDVPDRDRIPVDGVELEIRGPDDLTIDLVERLDKFEADRDRLMDAGDAKNVEEVNMILIDLMRNVVFLDPPSEETLRDTTYGVLAAWVDFFMSRSVERSDAAVKVMAKGQGRKKAPARRPKSQSPKS